MTNPENSPEPPKTGFKGLKVTLMQGIIGAITLAATTAIPILVQRVLSPQQPLVTPAQVAPISNDASNASSQSPSSQTAQPSPEVSPERNRDRKDRKKKD